MLRAAGERFEMDTVIKETKNYRLLIQYDGTRYNGWQKQGNTTQTIQGKLEAVLAGLCGCPEGAIEVHGSGRTDAGVHAAGQVANVHMNTPLSCQEIMKYLNRYLPGDIAVIGVTQVDGRFHSRLNAIAKTYCYRIYTGEAKPVFDRNYIWVPGERKPLHVPDMQCAACFLEGEHDFKSFCANKRMKKSTVRRIDSLRVEQTGDEVRIVATGNGFLFNMVRILAGTLYEVGIGARKPEEMERILRARDRQAAGMLAPAKGLVLEKVYYENSNEPDNKIVRG